MARHVGRALIKLSLALPWCIIGGAYLTDRGIPGLWVFVATLGGAYLIMEYVDERWPADKKAPDE